MKHTIELRLQEKGWMAKLSDPRAVEMYGTDTLPTGFTDRAQPEFVREYLQRLNPNVTVTLGVNS